MPEREPRRSNPPTLGPELDEPIRKFQFHEAATHRARPGFGVTTQENATLPLCTPAVQLSALQLRNISHLKNPAFGRGFLVHGSRLGQSNPLTPQPPLILSDFPG
jgi:hypothetical protein